ncbi:MAG: hypothetical protein WD603_00100 [Patescibacteria group bacterium]
MTPAEAATYDTWRGIVQGGEGAPARCYSGFGQRRGRFERYALVPRAARCQSGQEIITAMADRLTPGGRVVVIDGHDSVEVEAEAFATALPPERLHSILESADSAHREEDQTGRLITEVLRAVEETRTDQELAAVRRELETSLVA